MDGVQIWRLGIHPRMSLFIQKVAWRRLPPRTLLRARGIDILASCPCCGSTEETLEHAFFHCLRARQVWCLTILTEEPSITFQGMLWQSLEPDATTIDGVRVVYIAYQIQLAQDVSVFEAKWQPVRLVVERTLSLPMEIVEASLPDSILKMWDIQNLHPFTIKRTIFISCEPPSPNFLKINFDGSITGRTVGARCIIRDSNSMLIVVGGVLLIDISMLGAKDIIFCQTCSSGRLIDCGGVLSISWLEDHPDRGAAIHPLVQNTSGFLMGHVSSHMVGWGLASYWVNRSWASATSSKSHF